MQQLVFEAAWEKTIARKDRQTIIRNFEQVLATLPSTGVHFTLLKKAVNHRDDLLITVLIHNCNEKPLDFDRDVLQYRLDEQILARHTFHLPLKIAGKTSMPWTFIFPAGSYTEQALRVKGKLEIAARWV